MAELKDRLRFARERKSLTQLEACTLLGGLNNRALSRYETGTSEPDITLLTKLATLYEVSADWLLGLTDDTRSPRSSLAPPAILDDPALAQKIGGLTPASKEKLSEYADMLQTLDEVKGGSAALDIKKRKA